MSNKLFSSKVILFLALVFTLSTPFYYFIIQNGIQNANPLITLGLMWCPGISAIMTTIIFKTSLRTLGWSWGKWRYHLAAYIIPLLYAGIGYSIVWILGVVEFPNPTFLGSIAKTLGIARGAQVLIPGFFVTATIGFIVISISTLGEEIGWRGFLFPALNKRSTFIASVVVSSIIWSAWHYPLMIFGGYNNDLPAWFYLPVVTIIIFEMGFILSWLRLKSGSLWPAVVMHASHNAFIQLFFDPATVKNEISGYLVGEFGILTAVCCLIVVIIIAKKDNPLLQTTSNSEQED